MFNFGQVSDWTDLVTASNPTMQAVASAIKLPPLKGRFYQSMGALSEPLKAKVFEVFNRSKTSRHGVISASWDDSATTNLGIAPEVIKGLTIGHTLKVGNEIVIIKDVNQTANTVDVFRRGDANSTASIHSANDSFMMLGAAQQDTDLKNLTGVSESTSKYDNYAQTVMEVMDWTLHAEIMDRRGLSAAQATYVLIEEAQIRVAEMLSMMGVNGVKNLATVENKTRYMSAGLIAQLLDNNSGKRPVRVKNANGALTQEKLVAAIMDVFNSGGTVDTIWVSPRNKQIINGFNMANAHLSVGTSVDNHTAGNYINAIDIEGQIINIEVDLDMPNDKVPIIQQSDCKKGWLEKDPLRFADEPNVSSREFRKSITGTVGFCIENVGINANHTIITDITA